MYYSKLISIAVIISIFSKSLLPSELIYTNSPDTEPVLLSASAPETVLVAERNVGSASEGSARATPSSNGVIDT